MENSVKRIRDFAIAVDETVDYRQYPLPREFSEVEYQIRIARARKEMRLADIDALVITSSQVGQWFTGAIEPHSWHDRAGARSSWYILTPVDDCLYITPTNNHNFAAARRMTWVGKIGEIVERTDWPRVEIWGLSQMPSIFAELGLLGARLGFELGDTMTMGLSVVDYLALRELMQSADFVDAAPVIRRLMSTHTDYEVECVRRACEAGVWIHAQVPKYMAPGVTERELADRLADAFRLRFKQGYSYRSEGGWDVRNERYGEYNTYHYPTTDRPYRIGDHVCRGTSGASFRGFMGDVDRMWYLGRPPDPVRKWHRWAFECNRAMTAAIRPGARCSDIYNAGARIDLAFGLPPPASGRRGHGLRHIGNLSVHQDNHTILEPGMIISVEPMHGNKYGYFDLEDQHLVTATGVECLHEPASDVLPCIEV